MKDNKRIYQYSEVCFFRKTKAQFGGLSNMASGYPLIINNIKILSSEALYQACRFPHMPEVQQKIINQKSPMAAKMVSKPFRKDSREDWEQIRLQIMRWVLRVKLSQNFLKFGQLLETTFNKPIVEESKKEKYWGATPIDKDKLSGVNALGRLLMELRDLYISKDRFKLLSVPNPEVGFFKLMNEEITPVNEIDNFINFVKNESKTKLPVKSKLIMDQENIEQIEINNNEKQSNHFKNKNYSLVAANNVFEDSIQSFKC